MVDSSEHLELLESFKKMEDDPFPVEITRVYGGGVVDTVRVTGDIGERVKLFKEHARDAVSLFELPTAGDKVDLWCRLMIEFVPDLVKTKVDLVTGEKPHIITREHITNAPAVAVILMRRLEPVNPKNKNDNPVKDCTKQKRRPKRGEKQIRNDAVLVFSYLQEHPEATRDEVAKGTEIAGGTVSGLDVWKRHSLKKKEVRKANRAVSAKDMDSLPS